MNQPPNPESPQRWVALLRGVAGRTLRGTSWEFSLAPAPSSRPSPPPPPLSPRHSRTAPLASAANPRAPDPADAERLIEGFRDERGHRRAVDRPFLAHLLGVDPGDRPAGAMDPDVALWWSVHEDRPALLADLLSGVGPLFGQPGDAGIEVWTETELSALHAAWLIARRLGDRALRRRCLDAARWHAGNLQPDNATNHPWAVHVFVALGDEDADASAHLYAQTLVHNCQMTLGRPDLFSALLLADAARFLDYA